MFEKIERPLNAREVKRLKGQIRRLKNQIREWPRTGAFLLLLVLGLSTPVYLSNPQDSTNQWGALIIAGALYLVILWSGASITLELRARIRGLESTIKEGRVEEIHVVASRCFKIKEAVNEGSDYLFDIGDGRTLVVSDYEISKGKFPNSEFMLTKFFGPKRIVTGGHTVCKGEKLKPLVAIARDRSGDSMDFEHLQVIDRSFDDVVSQLRSRAGR